MLEALKTYWACRHNWDMTTEATDTQHQILINELQRPDRKRGSITTLLEMRERKTAKIEQTGQGDNISAFLKDEREKYGF